MPLAGPKKKPGYDSGGMQPGDFHLVVNDKSELVKCFDHTGKEQWSIAGLAKGVSGPDERVRGGDTPHGLWELGQLFKWIKGVETLKTLYSYGYLCYDMIPHENQEYIFGRDGICFHCGGTMAWPDPLADYQTLEPTLGCVRVHNKDMEKKVLPLTHKWDEKRKAWIKKSNRVWVSVHQDVA